MYSNLCLLQLDLMGTEGCRRWLINEIICLGAADGRVVLDAFATALDSQLLLTRLHLAGPHRCIALREVLPGKRLCSALLEEVHCGVPGDMVLGPLDSSDARYGPNRHLQLRRKTILSKVETRDAKESLAIFLSKLMERERARARERMRYREKWYAFT